MRGTDLFLAAVVGAALARMAAYPTHPRGEVLIKALLRWPSRGFDRMFTGDPEGQLFQVFDPPWWKLHRWAWWFTGARKMGRSETLLLARGEAMVVRAFRPRVGEPMKRFRGRRHG